MKKDIFLRKIQSLPLWVAPDSHILMYHTGQDETTPKTQKEEEKKDGKKLKGNIGDQTVVCHSDLETKQDEQQQQKKNPKAVCI